MNGQTVSAALFFEPSECRAVPWDWFQKARAFFEEYRLSPVLFSAEGEDFQPDDCFVLAEEGNDIVDEGERIAARGDRLIRALRSGSIEDLTLDSPKDIANGRSIWRASLDFFAMLGQQFIGIGDEFVSDPVVLMRHAYAMSLASFDVRYAYGYKMRIVEDPASYAIGGSAPLSSWTGLRAGNFANRQASEERSWAAELMNRRRHLNGLFRGAYPVNILTKPHLDRVDLFSHGIGRLSEVDTSHWIWEIDEDELGTAERLLARQCALISQG
jgi:hypothetical protein